jgi:hypothetical protein
MERFIDYPDDNPIVLCLDIATNYRAVNSEWYPQREKMRLAEKTFRKQNSQR